MEGVQLRPCRTCGALIVFVRTNAGKFMPCEKQSVPFKKDPLGRNQIITVDGRMIRCETNIEPEDADGYGYIPHFSKCSGPRKEPAKNIPERIIEKPKVKKRVKAEEPLEQLSLFGSGRRFEHGLLE